MTAHTKSKPANNQPDFYAPLRRALPVAEQVQGLMLRRARTGILRILQGGGAHTVLDVCCGSGCLACRLSMAGFDVTGVDSSPTMLDRARTKQRVARFLHCDACHMPFSGAFDAAVVSLALHEMDASQRDSVWGEMHRAVRPGGLLIALDFTISKNLKWYSRAVGRLIDNDEKQMGGINPAHYENFQEFMSTGGLEGWLSARERNNMTARYYGGGNLGVFTVAA
ncbi:MAG: class I SAM-dependent methyltransferase [Nitrospirota bacterium]